MINSENPFEINDLYEKAIIDIGTGKYKTMTKDELGKMRSVFVDYAQINKMFADVSGYLAMVDGEISKRESARTNFILLWAAIIAAIFAVIASWPIVKDRLPAFRSGEKSATSQSSQSNSIPK